MVIISIILLISIILILFIIELKCKNMTFILWPLVGVFL